MLADEQEHVGPQLGMVGMSRKPLAQRAPIAERHERLPKERVVTLLFACFGEKPHWSLRELIERTDQPAAYLKEILAEIAFYHERGPAHGLYELNADFTGGMRRPT